jgi:hypothetical protein
LIGCAGGWRSSRSRGLKFSPLNRDRPPTRKVGGLSLYASNFILNLYLRVYQFTLRNARQRSQARQRRDDRSTRHQ